MTDIAPSILAHLGISAPEPIQTEMDGTSFIGDISFDGLRARPLDAFLTVALPLSARGALTAAVLSFAHTVGEFGVILMVGGNIEGRTRTISIAVWEHVESLEYAEAHALSAGLLIFAFVTLIAVYALGRGRMLHVR